MKYYATKSDVMSAPLKDKIDKLLLLNSESILETIKDARRTKDFLITNWKEKNLEIGPLVYGEIYCEKYQHRYDAIGFLVKSEGSFNGNTEIIYGFRGIYLGKCDVNAPADIDGGTSLEPFGTISNGFGDSIDILEELNSSSEVNECIKNNNIDINKYLKDKSIYLAEKSHKEKTHSNMEASL